MSENKPKETWLPLPEYEGIYEVSDRGRVRSMPREVVTKDGRRFTRKPHILLQHKDRVGIHRVNLSKNGRIKQPQVPALVLTAFVRPRRTDLAVSEIQRFKDGDRSNNHVSNLEWVPRPGYRPHADRCTRGHKYFPENIERWAREHEHNRCLACQRGRDKAYRRGVKDKAVIDEMCDAEYQKILETMNDRDLY